MLLLFLFLIATPSSSNGPPPPPPATIVPPSQPAHLSHSSISTHLSNSAHLSSTTHHSYTAQSLQQAMTSQHVPPQITGPVNPQPVVPGGVHGGPPTNVLASYQSLMNPTHQPSNSYPAHTIGTPYQTVLQMQQHAVVGGGINQGGGIGSYYTPGVTPPPAPLVSTRQPPPQPPQGSVYLGTGVVPGAASVPTTTLHTPDQTHYHYHHSASGGWR